MCVSYALCCCVMRGQAAAAVCPCCWRVVLQYSLCCVYSLRDSSPCCGRERQLSMCRLHPAGQFVVCNNVATLCCICFCKRVPPDLQKLPLTITQLRSIYICCVSIIMFMFSAAGVYRQTCRSCRCLLCPCRATWQRSSTLQPVRMMWGSGALSG